jgi:hypothetical protein
MNKAFWEILPKAKACVAHALGARFLRRERTSTIGDSAGAINRRR